MSISTTGQRWQLDLGDGRLPLWVFDESRRVPDTSAADYLALAPLIWAGTDKLVGDAIPCDGTLYERLVQPLLLAALNVDPPEGSAGLAGAIVRETLLAGGQACRPLIARDGLSAVLIEPAVKLLQDKGGSVRFGHELRELRHGGERVSELNFGDDDHRARTGRCRRDGGAAARRGLAAAGPEDADEIPRHRQCAFPLRSARRLPAILGVVGGLVEWLFAFPERLSVTISNGDRLVDMPREELAQAIWRDVCKAAGRLPANCRPGRSCASAAPPSRRRRNRMRCGRAP